jgi:hypothetical protein
MPAPTTIRSKHKGIRFIIEQADEPGVFRFSFKVRDQLPREVENDARA